MFQQFIKQDRYISVFMCLFILLTAAGCSREESVESDKAVVSIKENSKNIKAENKEEGVQVEGDENQGQVKIKTKNGASIIAYSHNKLADGFPKDIPIYEPSTVQMSQIMDNGKNVMARLNTNDDLEKMVQFYKKALPRAGWVIKEEMNMRSMALIQGEKGEKELNVTMKKEQGEMILSIVAGNK